MGALQFVDRLVDRRSCIVQCGHREITDRLEDRIRAHVLLCWLALLLARIIETRASTPEQATTWPRARDQLQRLHVGTFTGPAGLFRQTTPSSAEVRRLHHALNLTLLPRILDLDPDRAATRCTIDFDVKQARCPQGQTSTRWNPVTQRGTDAIVIKFAAGSCRDCPVREQCTRSTSPKFGRQLTVPPREIHQAQQAARATQTTPDWQARYAARAGVEGTIRQAVAITGTRRARYRGLPKTTLEHVYSAVALNLIRLHAYWNGNPLDRTRTSHLTRLEHALAA